MFDISESNGSWMMSQKSRPFAKSASPIAPKNMLKATLGFSSLDLKQPSRCEAIVRRLETLHGMEGSMERFFRAVCQTQIDICLQTGHTLAGRRKFWAVRILVDDVVPTLVQNWLAAKKLESDDPLFDKYALADFSKFIQPIKNEQRWVERLTVHIAEPDFQKFLQDLDHAFPGMCVLLFLKDFDNRDVPWSKAQEDLGIAKSRPYPLRKKQSSQIS